MKKLIFYSLIFITFLLNSQEIIITEYDTTEDYYQDLYKLRVEEEKDEYFKRDFKLKKPILVSYKYFNSKYKLMKIHEVDYKSHDDIQYRGIIIYGMYYLFSILNYYKLRYDWEEAVFLCDALHINGETNQKKGILSLSRRGTVMTCEKKIELYQGKLAKVINFHESYGSYDLKERYVFTIILEE